MVDRSTTTTSPWSEVYRQTDDDVPKISNGLRLDPATQKSRFGTRHDSVFAKSTSLRHPQKNIENKEIAVDRETQFCTHSSETTMSFIIKRWLVGFVVLVVFLPLCGGSSSAVGSFTKDENEFLQFPSADSARKNLKYITSKPHVAGTVGDYEMAEFVRQEFEEAGIPNATFYNLLVGLNYPKKKPQLQLYETDKDGKNKVIYKADLTEDVLPEDTTSDTIWRNHTFHGYSPSGSVEGKMVYANYGRPDDFENLEKAGVSVKGKIVLVRYGRCFRGLKVWNAQKRGAIGVLIYSDPFDDGYVQGEVYPMGPWRSESSVQRGSVQFNSVCAGDPYRADPRYKEKLNTSLQELCGVDSSQDLIPSIPSLPLSYKDATPLLQKMGGPLAVDVGGDGFCGGIHDLTYRVGPSKDTLKMVVENTNKQEKIPNVVGVIPGKLSPENDMPVLLGNHRDAWVYGAADPNSGTAALLEVAKGLGALYKYHNWRPLRSIYLLSWSGEEYGLLGSTGWGELNQDLLSRALAYVNVDTVVSGDILKVSASPVLTTLWKRVMKDFNSTSEHSVPYENAPLGDLRDANTDWEWDTDIIPSAKDIGTLGSGSDYTVFLDHLGIPSLDFSFGKKATYGQYHSIYDSFSWIDHFGGHDDKPGSSFEIMAFGSKVWGVMAMRLANSPLVPLDVIAQGNGLSKYLLFIENQNVPGLDLTDLRLAITEYSQSAAEIELVCNNPADDKTLESCNEKLGLVERNFLLEQGLPNRPWFRHVMQAPGMNLGYAAEAFPGIQQAIDDGDVNLAQEQAKVAAERVLAAAKYLDH